MTNKHSIKKAKRQRRHVRVRSVVSGSSARPRLSVFRANRHMYAQIIDDQTGTTLAAATSQQITAKDKKSNVAKAVGKLLAEKAIAKNIKAVVFDRGGYLYHGRVKALAEGAREGGLEF